MGGGDKSTSSGYKSSSSRGICSVKAKTCIFFSMAVFTISSSVFWAWPQNCPEWLWCEKGILTVIVYYLERDYIDQNYLDA